MILHNEEDLIQTAVVVVDRFGTLYVMVPKGTKVNRTIVFEDETMFCTTFYPEGEDE